MAMFPNPENFRTIEVWPTRHPSFGEENPFRVVGIIDDYSEEVTIIADNFANRQLAEVWMRLYLEMYVKEQMFPHFVEGRMFEPLDTDD